MNIFDLKGPEFLIFYSVLLVIVVAVGIWLRQYLYRKADTTSDTSADSLRPYDVVYLAGGDKLTVNAALTSLIHQQLVTFNPTNKTLSVKAPMPPDIDKLEKRVYESIADTMLQEVPLKDTLKACKDFASPMQEKLERRGLLLTSSQSSAIRWWPLLLMVGLLLIGGIRIMMGLANHMPTTYLIFLWILTLLITLLGFTRGVRVSPRGDEILKEWRGQQAALKTTTQSNPSSMQSSDLVLALGLFGMGVMTAGMYGDLRKAILPQGSTGYSSGCGSGCGSGSSCGGGGSSCGGGGGCGGCGGGGGD